MGYFKDTAIERVQLPSNSDYWVDIQTSFKWGDVKKLADNGEVGIETSADKFLLTAIKSWNLDDESGNIVEINSANIDRLEQVDVELIIEKASGNISDQESKKNSSSRSTPTIAAHK